MIDYIKEQLQSLSFDPDLNMHQKEQKRKLLEFTLQQLVNAQRDRANEERTGEFLDPALSHTDST